MTKYDIIVGLMIKPHPEAFAGHGIVEYISEGDFVGIQWYNEVGDQADFSEMPMKLAINSFEYGGWMVLSSLERELI